MVWLYRLFPSGLAAIAIVKPETVIRWRRRWRLAHCGNLSSNPLEKYFNPNRSAAGLTILQKKSSSTSLYSGAVKHLPE